MFFFIKYIKNPARPIDCNRHTCDYMYCLLYLISEPGKNVNLDYTSGYATMHIG